MKKVVKVLKVVSFILILLILLELFYIIYITFFKPSKSVYFDGVNAFSKLSSGYVAVGSNNDNEMHLEKAKLSVYNKRGEKSLEKVYNKGYNSTFSDVVYDDGYVAVGSYEIDEYAYEHALRKALIVKYDSNGNIVFEKSFGSLENSIFLDIEVVDDGYLVVGQSIYDNMSLGFSDSGGAILIKYSKFGEEIWRKNYGSNKEAIYNSILVDGGFIYTVGKDLGNVGLLCKYDLEGNFIKNINYNGTDDLGFTSIIIDDYIYISGADSNKKALIAKYDKDCNFVGDILYDQVNTRFNNMIFDDNKNIIVIGSKNNGQELDGLLVKYDNNFNLIRDVLYGDDSDDYFTDLIVNDNNYMISAYSSYYEDSYLSKFITYSDALKVLEVK